MSLLLIESVLVDPVLLRRVLLVRGFDMTPATGAHFEAISLGPAFEANTPHPAAKYPFDEPVICLHGTAACVFSPWELDRTVQLRQELMLGMCEFEQAGYYAKEALAALGGDRKLPHPGLVRTQVSIGDRPVWVFFAPEPEIEALRTAVCRQLWTEINNCRSFEALSSLVERYENIAETEDECVHVAAGYIAVGLPETARAIVVDLDAAEFEEPIKRAEMLADVVKGRIEFAIHRDGN